MKMPSVPRDSEESFIVLSRTIFNHKYHDTLKIERLDHQVLFNRLTNFSTIELNEK